MIYRNLFFSQEYGDLPSLKPNPKLRGGELCQLTKADQSLINNVKPLLLGMWKFGICSGAIELRSPFEVTFLSNTEFPIYVTKV